MPVTFAAVVLNTSNPVALAGFYRELLGWDVVDESPEWVRLRDPERERPGLSFQLCPDDPRPDWPDRTGDTPMQSHLDLMVDELDTQIARAVALGATVEDSQPQPDVRVLRDPHGHLFCLFPDGA